MYREFIINQPSTKKTTYIIILINPSGKEGLYMAEIVIRNTNERIAGEENVRAFLEKQGVIYESWETTKLPNEYQSNFQLNDDQKQEILDIYDVEIKDLAARRGYKIWDVITLSDSTPNLSDLLNKFEEVHTHTEDEIRAIVAGKGIFVIKGAGDVGYFDVELTAGDVISVPENTNHFFTLMENRQIIAVRLFVEENGWISQPVNDPDFQKA